MKLKLNRLYHQAPGSKLNYKGVVFGIGETKDVDDKIGFELLAKYPSLFEQAKEAPKPKVEKRTKPAEAEKKEVIM